MNNGEPVLCKSILVVANVRAILNVFPNSMHHKYYVLLHGIHLCGMKHFFLHFTKSLLIVKWGGWRNFPLSGSINKWAGTVKYGRSTDTVSSLHHTQFCLKRLLQTLTFYYFKETIFWWSLLYCLKLFLESVWSFNLIRFALVSDRTIFCVNFTADRSR